MTTAGDVAALLRARLPGVGVKKLHKLLYYCQGHHLAAFGTPLFEDSVMAWDMGPVVGRLWYEERDGATAAGEVPALTEAELNTVGYVVSRYGGLSGRDLEVLTHGETPWQQANATRPAGTSVRIEREWLTEFFRAAAAESGDDDPVPLDPRAVEDWLAGARERLAEPTRRDSLGELRARLSPGV
jgi:uncharacterized phage-associated protein